MRQSIAKRLVIALTLLAGIPRVGCAGTVAVLAALDRDLETFKKEVELVGRPLELGGRPVYQARFNGHPLLVTKTGANPDSVAAMIRWLVEDRHVQAVVSVGPAGTLNDRIAVGEVVVAQQAVLDGGSAAGATWTLSGIGNCDAHAVGTVVTVAAFVADQRERARLRTSYHADLVDMSAAVIAKECASHHLPCVIIREITDRAGPDAPQTFDQTLHARRPSVIPSVLCALRRLIDRLPGKGFS
ncbi:MAG TPA: hypothetical protein VL171_02065 [Verrucomicrobiae bacterium]|nr:hypothetical protein [Verrucomicrobiae bacterium]